MNQSHLQSFANLKTYVRKLSIPLKSVCLKPRQSIDQFLAPRIRVLLQRQGNSQEKWGSERRMPCSEI